MARIARIARLDRRCPVLVGARMTGSVRTSGQRQVGDRGELFDDHLREAGGRPRLGGAPWVDVLVFLPSVTATSPY
jgi:hypothetical protein